MADLALIVEGSVCCPNCDTSLLEGVTWRTPLENVRRAGWRRRRTVGDCPNCGRTYRVPREALRAQ
ncbi:MAG TPA: hypothetical protein VHX38_03005 [Pseudonocardiaceae bacterium]|nr:hypothetical protein [Pseudonocardiaceae bacterium]